MFVCASGRMTSLRSRCCASGALRANFTFFVVATIAVLVVLQSLRVASAEPLAPGEPPNVGDAKFARHRLLQIGSVRARPRRRSVPGQRPAGGARAASQPGCAWCWTSTTRCCRTGRSSWQMTSAACSRARAGLCPMVHADGLRGTCAQGRRQSGKCLRFSSKRVHWALRCSSSPAGMSGNAPPRSRTFVRWVLPELSGTLPARSERRPFTPLPPRTSRPPVRERIEKDGYTIIANAGDQPSDLAGGHAEMTFLLPNPFYRIP